MSGRPLIKGNLAKSKVDVILKDLAELATSIGEHPDLLRDITNVVTQDQLDRHNQAVYEKGYWEAEMSLVKRLIRSWIV